jgi:subtilisin family serine protease
MAQLPQRIESAASLPEHIQGYASFTSQGEKSIFATDSLPKQTKPYYAKKNDRRQAIKALEAMGFQIVAKSQIGAAIVGPAEAYEELTGGKAVAVEVLSYEGGAVQRYRTHIDIVGKKQPKCSRLGNVKSTKAKLEGVMLERPQAYANVFPTPIPPIVDDFYLRVPNDVALILSANEGHRNGHTGDGVKIAMVDSGQEVHPFFTAHHYDVEPAVTVIPGTNPAKDPVGHGVGESANIFALAPGATLQPVRASDNNGNLVGAIGGFLHAKSQAPAILTNSWGGDGPFPPLGLPSQADIAWAIEIFDAVQNGIFVVFSAGNGSFTIEPQVPGVLAAGGVFATADLEMQASNYASGYPSPWFQNVTVPTVCGLVGQTPRAKYIMLPLPPGSSIDVSNSQPTTQDPEPDGTASNDGWARFSGTSAAAPQIAGAAAMILAAKPGLSPDQITQALTATAIDITSGHCSQRFNFPAQVGHDSATGHGLIDASAAVQFALDNF